MASVVLVAALAVSVHASLALQGLYADGAYNLFGIVDTGNFVADWDPPRWTAHVLQQFAAVIAMRLGVDDPEPLGVLLSLGMYVVPLCFLAGCYLVPPPGARSFFLLPLFHYLAGSQAAGVAGIAEAPMATAYFWFLLFLILFRSGLLARGAALALAIPALWLHEALALLGPLLALAAMVGLRRRGYASTLERTILIALVLWFVAVALYDVHAISIRARSRDGYLLTILALSFIFDFDYVDWVMRINVPAVLGILAALAVAFIWWEGRLGDTQPARVAVAGSALVSAALVAGTLWHGALFAPHAQFSARSWGALISLPLGVLCLGSLLRPQWRATWERRSTVILMSILAAAQLGWQTIATGFWSSYVHEFREVLASREGLIAWRDAVEEVPAEQRWVFRRMAWDWTNPALSFVLSPHGRVSSVIASFEETGYHPFDPADREDLPGGRRFDTTQYRAALLLPKSAITEK